MTLKYVITYNYRDPFYNKEMSGIWMTNSLAEVGAFFDMVKRYGGVCDWNYDLIRISDNRHPETVTFSTNRI